MRRLALPLAALLLTGANNPATSTEHTVAEGETLGGIANRAKVPAAVIAAANGLAEPYVVKEGQRLSIPRQRVHTVKPGETGLAIAARYGVPFEKIAIANGLEPPFTIRPGSKLIVPAVVSAAPAAVPVRDEPYFRWPHDGKVLLGYARRADGGGHEGLDIAVSTGDMIRAASAGTVIYAGDEPRRFGRLVVLDHGQDWYSAYGHLARVTVKKGDVVKAGERVGIGGESGDAERPELHFEIRQGKLPIDPRPKLAKRGGAG